jgi:hypothetical protein
MLLCVCVPVLSFPNFLCRKESWSLVTESETMSCPPGGAGIWIILQHIFET